MSDTAQEPKRRGNPNWQKKGLQEPAQEAVQEPAREAMQVGTTQNGRTVVRVNGEDFTRKRRGETNQFDIPANVIPEGWEYQWNVQSVTGEPATDSMIAMAENGWRPVPAGRHPGMFMPRGTPVNAEILRGGLRLEERPKVLSDEAREEERMKAQRQVSDQNEALMLSRAMPSGFSRDNPNLKRMERAGTKRTVGPAPDIARPVLPIDESA